MIASLKIAKFSFVTKIVNHTENSILLTMLSMFWLLLSIGILVVVVLLELNALPNIRFQGSGCVTAVQSK